MCKLIVVTNRKLCSGNFLEQIKILAENDVDQIVLREKDMNERDYGKLAVEVQEICKLYGTDCVLHNHFGVAKRLDADGIHLPLLTAMKNRENLRTVCFSGVSTHSVEQVQLAEACFASYVFFGHVFPTKCKEGVPAKGISMLAEVCDVADIPVYALGGISPDNVEQVLDAGAEGACVMSWGMQAGAKDIRKMARFCHQYQRKEIVKEKDIFAEIGMIL